MMVVGWGGGGGGADYNPPYTLLNTPYLRASHNKCSPNNSFIFQSFGQNILQFYYAHVSCVRIYSLLQCKNRSTDKNLFTL